MDKYSMEVYALWLLSNSIESFGASERRFDLNGDHVLDFEELKRMMEILGTADSPGAQGDDPTGGRGLRRHHQLQGVVVLLDSSQFLLIFKKARDGELSTDGGLSALARLTSIDVEKAGVGGAKSFFEAKAMELNRGNRFEEDQQEQLAKDRRGGAKEAPGCVYGEGELLQERRRHVGCATAQHAHAAAIHVVASQASAPPPPSRCYTAFNNHVTQSIFLIKQTRIVPCSADSQVPPGSAERMAAERCLIYIFE
ncbi:hypothetical protein HPB52_010420 [Rhipicephalus sanguineus]|uniref:EF-hand domain-containing protein n=1 Tax=Rhipicephalus sanguineus TaxID=34632 RepID=A0A9D4SWF8_RHISA|nr:hypothetical protein HPB52_010420 [Rhipicephalus sanguineus]